MPHAHDDRMGMHDALTQCGLRWPKGGMLTCPLHKDKRPSLALYGDHYYCFSCNATGDAYGFIAMWQRRDIADVLAQYRRGQDNPILRPSRSTIVEVGPQSLDERRRRQWRDLNALLFRRLHRVFQDLSTDMLIDEIERMADQFEQLAEDVDGLAGFDYERTLREFRQQQEAYLDRAEARYNGWQLGALRNKYEADGQVSANAGRDTDGRP